MKKLLFVMHSLCSGGAERSLVNLLNELPEDKYEIDLILFKQEGMFLPQVPEWVNIIDTPEKIRLLYNPVRRSGKMMYTKVAGTVLSGFQEKDIYRSKAYRWKHFYREKIKVLEKRYDAAIAYISGEVLYFVGDKVHADRKYVWIHNDYLSAGYSKEDDFPYLNRMDGIISVSDTCVKILKAVFPEFRHKIYLIENITSSSAVRKRADEFVPSEFKGCENSIVSIGRLDLQKGFDLAIQAAELLKKRGISFRWMVLGSGSLKKQLQRQIDQAGLNDVFFLLGAKENPYPYLKYCTLFVQPSRFEGKSVVLDEAKILGTPIIAAAYPTVNDQIEHGKEGYIAGTSPESLADGIEELLLHRELRENLSRYLLSREYGNSQEVKKYIALFDSLVEGEERRHGGVQGREPEKAADRIADHT